MLFQTIQNLRGNHSVACAAWCFGPPGPCAVSAARRRGTCGGVRQRLCLGTGGHCLHRGDGSIHIPHRGYYP